MGRKGLTAALAAAILAVVLSCVALVVTLRDDEGDRVAPPRDDGRAKVVDGLARDVESLKGDIAKLSSRLEALAERADRPAPPAKVDRAQVDPDQIGRIVDERMRESIVMATGKARMQPDALPAVVAAAAAKTLEGAQITRAEQRRDGDRTYYKLKTRLGGREYDLRITAEGKVTEAEMPVDLAPQVVKEAAAKAVEGIVLSQVKLEPGRGGQLYDVEGRSGGRKYDLQILPDGQVIEIDGPGGKKKFPAKPRAGGERPAAGDGGGGVF
ncbi:MAG: hypothetical protein ACYTFI_22800 [Planctomycetota bacterium]|jgi:uncharacterized membrane protein YkoI